MTGTKKGERISISHWHLSSEIMTTNGGESPQEELRGGKCETAASLEACSKTSASSITSHRRQSRILFGSCNSQNLTQPLWPIITSRNAAAFVWAGDSIYADQFAGLDFSHFPPQAKHVSATPDQLRSYYKQQLSHPEYRKLIESNITIFGTVDDHDYGQNNGDRTYKYRRESGLAHVDFVGEPPDSPIRRRAERGRGVYGVKVFDFSRDEGDELVPNVEAGIDSDVVNEDNHKSSHQPAYSKRSVAVFVLDVRSNRDPWPKGIGAWFPSNGDMLGEEQWRWFESSLNRSKAAVNIIVSGLQVHADRFPSANVAEEWVKFPKARQRLYEIILRSGARSPFIVSGDVHMTQLSRKDCYRRKDTGDISSVPRPLVELTTSGLTHSWGTCFASSERYHTAWYAPYFHFMSRASMGFNHLEVICPWNELVETASASLGTGTDHILFENGGAEESKTGKQFSLELNFGELEFDWQNEVVSMRVFGVSGTEQPMLSAKWAFAQLNGDSIMSGSSVGQNDIEKVASQLSADDQWVCVDYHGLVSPLHYFVSTSMGVTLLFTLILLPNILSILTVLWIVRWILNKLK